MIQTLKFYSKLSLFSVKEEQSSLSATIAGLLLYPCFIWIFAKLWLGLNDNISTLGSIHLFAYIGLTEILHLTSLREPHIDRANSDFLLSFVRPRSWTFCAIISIYSRTLYRRAIYLVIYILIIPLFTENFVVSWQASLRFILLLPLLTVLESQYAFLFTCAQIRFHSVKNFRSLFGKLFLIFGGVLAPLSDIPDRWQKIFIYTPFSDLIFQPCYFSVQGEFYKMTLLEWLSRVGIQCTTMSVLASLIYTKSRRHYHNFGG